MKDADEENSQHHQKSDGESSDLSILANEQSTRRTTTSAPMDRGEPRQLAKRAHSPVRNATVSKRERADTTGNTRNRFFRNSIFRVNSKRDGMNPGDGASSRANKNPLHDEIPNSPRTRASTYSHVHDAVMYNLSEAERSKHDQSVPMGVIGLQNLGNTCFINSSLQCLSATIPLTDYFLGYDYRSEINHDNFLGTGGKMATAYAELMKQMWLGSKSTVQPSAFKEQLSTFAPQFTGYHQHDSQELLSFLLDGIHEDLNRVKSRPYVEDKDCDGTQDEEDAILAWKNYLKRNKSLVVDLFQGQLRNTCQCLTCKHVNIRFEPFMYLSLPISAKTKSLDDCINLYLEQETLKGGDQWYCEKCKKHVDATKKTDLWILPPILIVHLKRFRYNEYGKAGSKNDQSINYPVHQWDLKRHVHSKRGIYPVYDLYAISNHVGSLGGGHYTAVALNRFDDLWYDFNDKSYKMVDESIHQQHRKSGYVLFYNRSEGDDKSMPLNERSPVIRRQSVSRPDLWPHTQMDDRAQVRNFTRSSRRFHDSVGSALIPPSMPHPYQQASNRGRHTTSLRNRAGSGDAAAAKDGNISSSRSAPPLPRRGQKSSGGTPVRRSERIQKQQENGSRNTGRATSSSKSPSRQLRQRRGQSPKSPSRPKKGS